MKKSAIHNRPRAGPPEPRNGIFVARGEECNPAGACFRITEGAREVMKMVIARRVLKAYG
jgi:hypothetical protein